MKLDVLSTSAKKLATISVSAKIFNAKINPSLMNQAVRVYLSNQRLASARTKDRNDINVTHAKVWRQKGTGRARHGSRNAPVFVGGSKTHGPSGFQNFYLKLPQKMKQLSLFSALTAKLKEGEIGFPKRLEVGNGAYGFHIIKLIKRIPEHKPDIEIDYDEIKKITEIKKREDQFKNWLSEIKENIFWEVRI